MKSKGEFEQALKARRQDLGLSQRALAEELGVKASHVAYLETGRRKPSLALLKRIADTLGFDSLQLLVLARPDAKELVGPSPGGAVVPGAECPVIRGARCPMVADAGGARPKSPDQAWRELIGNRALLARYQVTPRELRALKQLSLFGHVLSPREFLAILTLIRS